MTYFANGNIQIKPDISANTAFTYGTGTGARPYALTKVTSSAGVISAISQTATYTSFEKVNTLTEGAYAATFAFNSDNQRARMVVTQSGSTILTRWYVGSSYLKQTEGSVTKEYTWIGGDAYSAPCQCITQNGTTTYYYLMRDHLGSITHVTDASGSVLNEYSYDAWGRRRNFTNWGYSMASQTDILPDRGFTGHEFLKYFNLYNMNGRLYDPLVARFLNVDPYGQMPDFTQNLNRYSYCLNNPLKYTDPSGEIVWAPIIAFAIWGGALNTATHRHDIGNFWQGLGYFGVGAGAGVAGGFAGQAVAGALGTATSFGGAVANGGIVGASGGFAGGFVGGAGNAWMGGAGFGLGLQAGLVGGGYGALGGALFGGISGGFQYQRQISVFQKGCAELGVNGGDPVPATDQFLSDAQKSWYKKAPMNNIKAFTVEKVPVNAQKAMDAVSAPGLTRTSWYGTSGKLTGISNVYFNRNLAFSSAKQLFFTMGHEFVHVSQFSALTGQSHTLLTQDFRDMLDFHAYSYQNSIGGLQLNSFTKEEILFWSTTYSQFNSMNYINFPWSFNHSFVYPF